MPGRDVKKSDKKSSPAGRGAKVRVQPQKLAASAQTDLAHECERLRGELAAAHERIAELEAGRNEVLDRIAWVIDSLHNLAEE
jgi:hypothetical protein